MIGLTRREIYNPFFSISAQKNKLEFYTDIFNEFLFEELKDILEEILNISNTTPYHLQDEIMGPRTIEAYKKLGLEEASADGYVILLTGYAGSPIRVFESYLRIIVGLDEDDIRMFLKQYNSNFVSYNIEPDFY